MGSKSRTRSPERPTSLDNYTPWHPHDTLYVAADYTISALLPLVWAGSSRTQSLRAMSKSQDPRSRLGWGQALGPTTPEAELPNVGSLTADVVTAIEFLDRHKGTIWRGTPQNLDLIVIS